ncbi:hypothetical protein N7519_010417 [Penicillium mononematosum]|uniref:uncharacterized protein n=1 Tax=Penicillium mononematosum TaxID=268346 RepID=UPI0025490C56|nr:uncharacterized protein N7519_010417 [Penicillium mononematosum]KAJ6179956.1 hypothetical protein N7519_010417 [Penicillium mononematosum]
MAEARLASPESVEQEIETIPPPGDVEKSQSVITEINTNAQIDEFPLPTEAESHTLRRVSGTLPLVAFSLCLVEFAERASYYGSKTVFSNFIQFPLPEGGNGAGATPRGTQQTAGALGMGLQASSALTLLFVFLSYVIPIFGGWWADVHVGRYKAIMVGVVICGVAHMIQIIGAIPSVLQKGSSNAAPPFILGLLVLSAGAGIFKPNVSPLILDQIRQKKAYTKQLKSGEKVIVDPDATNTRTMLIFYGFINIGAFFMLATTYAEKYVGFWLSFLLTGIIYLLLPILLLTVRNRIHKEPPRGGSELARVLNITTIALKQNKFRVWRTNFWEAADPDTLRSKGITVDWTRDAVKEIARTLGACDVFLFFPIWNLNVGGIGSVVTNQGAAMITNGVPNDVLSNFSPLTIIVAIPLLTFVVYPTLHRYRIHVGPITRLTFGFFLAMISGIVGTIVQWKVYKLSPCGYYASTCDTVAPISIWWQAPNIVLGALSECFCNVTAYELAYARSPPSMKGLVVAIFLFMNALSSALGEILIPVTKDPWLLWIWGAPAVALALQTIIFWARFKGLNNTMDGTDVPHRSEDEVKSDRRTPTGSTMNV